MSGEASHDRNAAASTGASGEIVRLAVVSTVVLILFAGGLYWLHQQPTQLPAAESGTSIQVRLLTTPEATPIPVPASEAAVSTASNGESEQPSPDPSEDMSEETTSTPALTVARLRPPSSPAIRMNPTSSRRASPDLAFRFQQALQRHIARFQHYPALARDSRLEGTVHVMFRLRRDGTISDAWIQTTSGQMVLDEEALATVRRAEPLPPIPGELPDQLRVLLPIAFAP